MSISITHTHGARLAALASECIIGEALSITATLLNADGTARDCTGGTVAFSWERPGGSGPTLSITAAGEATGIHTLSLPEATTQLLDAKYAWDAWFSPPTGAREQLIAQSSLTMLPAVGPFGAAESYSRAYGTTANRPTDPRPGEPYFDATLGYPIWWSGSAWVGSTGASV